MSSASSESGEPVGKATFVDPLCMDDSSASPSFAQKPRGGPSCHDHDVRRETYFPANRLHELPQWTDAAATVAPAFKKTVEGHTRYVYDSRVAAAHPQWQTGYEAGLPPEIATATVTRAAASHHVCAACKRGKDDCTCTTCKLCQTSVGRGSRHHCRRCWETVCGKCRSRKRYLNAMSWMKTKELVCDKCAVLKGLATLTEDPKYIGVALLKEAMDAPLQCVDRLGCGSFTYAKSCPNCSLPTVPSRPHAERLVAIDYCCSVGRRCAKCANTEQRMRAHEQNLAMERMRRFDALTPEEVSRIWSETLHVTPGGLAGALRWADEQKVRDVVLSLLAASVSYEYAAYPNTTLELSDVAAARRLLRLRECRQDFTILEAPDNLTIVAFPGTHDLRTTVTDIKFARVTQRSFSRIHEGLSRSDPGQPYRAVCGGVNQLWHYRMHEGFHEEERKMRLTLTTATLRNIVVGEGRRVVFTGHSLGGALAVLTTIRVLEEDLAAFSGRVSCVTFGAPLVGNSALATKVRHQGWAPYFTHLVAKSDVVPRLLTERDLHRHMAHAIHSALRGFFAKQPDGGSQDLELGDASPLGDSMSAADAAGARATDDDVVVRERDDDEEEDEGFTATGTKCALGKLAFDCFGQYHMMQRNVPYKATRNHLAAYNSLRDGDGLKLDIGDHMLDSYNRCMAHLLREHATRVAAGGDGDGHRRHNLSGRL